MKIQIIKYYDYGSNLVEQLGGQAASGIVGEGMGLLFAGANRANADKQQQDFTNIQEAANEQLSAFNANQQYNEQMKMWNATNYPAQVQQLQQAGLNPALLYGKGGAGGATTGSITGGGSVSGGTASNTPSGQGLGMGMVTPMTSAQVQNVQADTELKQAQATKLSGVDTKNVEASTANLTQGIENQKTAQALMQAQTAATNITADNVQTQTKEIEDQIGILDNDVQISNATKDAKINTIVQTATNAVISGNLMKAGIQVDQAQIGKMAQDIAQVWQSLTLQQQQQKVQQILMTAQTGASKSSAELMDKEKSLLLTQTIISGIGAVSNLIKGAKPAGTTQVEKSNYGDTYIQN